MLWKDAHVVAIIINVTSKQCAITMTRENLQDHELPAPVTLWERAGGEGTSETYLEPSRTSTMEPFLAKIVNDYFRKKAPS